MNKQRMRSLDYRNFPFPPVALIEASAGTGKTYSIAQLYIRCVLGIGCDDRKVEQILVVTFTKAAVAELRGRIRSVLTKLLDVVRRQDSEDSDFGWVVERLDRDNGEQSPERAVLLLEQALMSMDDAAIYTIHGFCQKVLMQFSFESGTSFELTVADDQHELPIQAVKDCWRNMVYEGEHGKEVARQWKTPEQLYQDVRGDLGQEVSLYPKITEQDFFSSKKEYLQLLGRVREGWRESGGQVFNMMLEHVKAERMNKRSYKEDMLVLAFEEMNEWATSEGENAIPTERLIKYFSAEHVLACIKKNQGQHVEIPQIFRDIDELCATHNYWDLVSRNYLRSYALHEAEKRLAELCRQQKSINMDGLLESVRNGLSSEAGSQLASLLLSAYPIAMVDEFQDTDPVQYQIFSQIYLDERVEKTSLLMIGDPKQAIYSFRGADIHAYLQARQDCPEEWRYTLDTNYRSTEQMVEACNDFFSFSESPFVEKEIPFQRVKSGKGLLADSPWYKEETETAALQLVLMDAEKSKRNSKTIGVAWQGKWIACEVAKLLRDQHQTGLKASDIAIMVRGHAEVAEIRNQLAAQGIGSIYRGKDSVFHSVVAVDLQQILHAMARPQDGRAIASALATRLTGISLADCYDIIHDDVRWQTHLDQFQQYHDIWSRRGILPALFRMFDDYHLLPVIRKSDNGERNVTDLIHLAELLQKEESKTGIGMAELLKWMQQKCEESGEAEDSALRLESEQNLVQIITIHYSKGLQYAVTFVAGMWSAVDAFKNGIVWHEGDQLCKALSENDLKYCKSTQDFQKIVSQAKDNALSEDMRLLYVALTRSTHRCYLLMAPVGQNVLGSALNYALASEYQAGEKIKDQKKVITAHWFDQAEKMVNGSQYISLVSVEHDYADQLDAISVGNAKQEGKNKIQREDNKDIVVRKLDKPINSRWRMSSYTGITRGMEHPKAEFYEPAERHSKDEEQGSAKSTLFTFPKGAQAGIFLHELFEDVDFAILDHGCSAESRSVLDQLVINKLSKHGYDQVWKDVLVKMLFDVGQSLLFGEVQLCKLKSWQAEQDFTMSVTEMEVKALESNLDWLPKGYRKPGLNFSSFEGLLRGAIDLVFEFNGRFYLADFKSNHLGFQSEDYSQGALLSCMAEHRYDVQAAIYSVALHRYLHICVPGYTPEKHFGGVAYLFLRGMEAGSDNGVWCYQPDSRQLEAIELAMGGQESVA